MNYKNETFLLEQNIENDFKDFLSKMILIPFKEQFHRVFRFSPFSKETTEDLLKTKDVEKIQKINNNTNITGNMIKDVVENNSNNYFIKRIDRQKYEYYPSLKIFESVEQDSGTKIINQRSGAWYVTNYTPKLPYYFAVAENIFETNEMIGGNNNDNDNVNVNNYNTYNSYVYLLHHMLDETERKTLKKIYNNNTKIMKKQLMSVQTGGLAVISTIPQIQKKIIYPELEPEVLSMKCIV